MNRDDKIEFILDRMRSAWAPAADTVDAERAAFEDVAALFSAPHAVREETRTINGVSVLALAPEAYGSGAVILYFHGGAFALGSARIYREQSARLVLASGAQVINVDYRLAPEHPFPAAPDDALAAFRGLTNDSGIDAGSIVVAGDSAGANLALGLCQRLRDSGEPLPAGQVLISPWVDLTCSGRSMMTNANPRHLAQRQGLLSSAATYLDGHDPMDPLASPLLGDLSGLPQMLIQVGSDETLLDDARVLRQRATEAGVAVTLEVAESMFHEWHLLAALLPAGETLDEAETAVASIGEFVRNVTA